jgi:hypothetical protein
MDLYIQKTEFGLIPVSDEDKAIVRGWAYGDVVKCELKRERNPRHHRKFFALLKATMHHLPEAAPIKSNSHLLDLLKFETGYFETFVSLHNEVIHKPKSISFGSMPQDEFNLFYSDCLDVICSKLLTEISKEDFERDILNFL